MGRNVNICATPCAAYSVIVLSVCHMNNQHMDKVADHPSKNLSVSDVKAMLDIVPMVIIVNLYVGLTWHAFVTHSRFYYVDVECTVKVLLAMH
jgi:hypothetical protein